MRHEERILLTKDDIRAFIAGRPIVLTLGGRTTTIAYEAKPPSLNGGNPALSESPIPKRRGSKPGRIAYLKPGHKCKYCSKSFAGLPIGIYAGHVRHAHPDRFGKKRTRAAKASAAKSA
jgi:hypothetical protein